MKEIKNKVKSILRENGEVCLPLFVKNTNGEYELKDLVRITSLKELKQYLETYSEISSVIKKNYQRQICAIYKSALGSLIKKPNSQKISQFGSSFTDTDYDLQVALGSKLSERTLKRILRGNAFAKQRFRPGKNLTQFMQQSFDDGIVVLPKFSENGVEIVPDEKLGSISVKYNKFDYSTAEKIRESLLNEAQSISDPEILDMVTEKINTLFHNAYMLEENGVSEYMLRRLADVAIDLVGVDMEMYNKRKYNRDPKNKTVATNVNKNSITTGKVKETLSGSELKNLEGEVRQIIIDGRNLIHQQKSGDLLTTIISPEDNELCYKLKLVGKIATFSQEEEPHK